MKLRSVYARRLLSPVGMTPYTQRRSLLLLLTRAGCASDNFCRHSSLVKNSDPNELYHNSYTHNFIM